MKMGRTSHKNGQ